MSVIVFERSVGQEDSRESLYVKLECEDENGLSDVLPQSLFVAEAFSYASPIITVTFKDQYGVYVNLLKIDPETEFTLFVGETKERANSIPLKLSRIDLNNNVSGKSENISFKISFVHTGWDKLINRRYCRAWKDIKFSEIIEEIAGECGFGEIDVKESRFEYEEIVQPHWPNNIFIKWIQENAIPENFDDHYEFGTKIDNSFFFKSISDIVEENIPKAESGGLPLIKLHGYENDPEQRTSDKSSNEEVPPQFMSFNGTEYYIDSVVTAGSVRSMHYDFEKGELVDTPTYTKDMDSFQMSDWSSIKQTHEETQKVVYHGRNKYGEELSKLRMSHVQISTNQFTITTEGSIDLHIGDMVEVIVPTPTNMIPPFSLLYSGFYLVGSITHNISLEPSPMIVSKIELTRQGFDDRDLKGYTETALGKFVGEREPYEGKIYVQS